MPLRAIHRVGIVLLLAVLSARATPPAEPGESWALSALARPGVPAHLADHPIDAFVRAALIEQGRDILPPAEPRQLVRRLHVDLHGLLPTSDEVREFGSGDPRSIAITVTRLLASPHYGERWARHWLDVVGYAETHGHDQDRPRESAWPYRDYVIDAFNADKPYARFVMEQVAADALFPDHPELTPALGFLAAGPWDESSLRDIREDTLDREIGRYLDRDEILANVFSTFTATTVHCARCHDHKFDPIPQEDYYALQAVFAGTEKAERLYDLDPEINARRMHWMQIQVAADRLDSGRIDELLLADPPLRDDLLAWEAGALFPTGPWLPHAPDLFDETNRIRFLLERATRDLALLPEPRRVYAGASLFPANAGQKPVTRPRTVHVLRRGEITQPRGEATPGALSCLPHLPSRFEKGATDPGRRAALAEWLAHPENPLTWRVIVNRVWHHHFGRGLVDTPNDFGRMGGRPVHPQLLDWLAVTFRDDFGGSLKRLHELILTSRTWQQASADPATAHPFQPLRRRLDAESFRDSLLRMADRLDTTMGGPSVRHFAMSDGIHVTPIVDYSDFDVDSAPGRRRSIYRFLFRTLPDPLMDCMDSPAGDESTPVRNESFTALQAFALLNHPFVIRCSEHIAARAETGACASADPVRTAFHLVLQRDPSPAELTDFAAHAGTHGLASAVRVLLNCNELHFVE